MNHSATTTRTTTTPPEAEGFWRAWRWWLPPALLALALTFFYLDPFIGDWDGLDYTVLALHGEPSSMALGRLFFIFFNHALWRIAHALFHLPPEKAYLLFKYTVVAQSPLAVMACWTLARDLTRSRRVATIAALLVVFSPVFVIYSGQVMTDVPSLLLVTLALILHLRGLRKGSLWLVLAGAMLLGAGVNMRETVAFYAPWLAFAPLIVARRLSRREIKQAVLACVVFLIFALVPFATWYALDINNYRSQWQVWRESMRMESARHPIGLGNVPQFLIFFFALSPLAVLALPVAGFKEWRARGLTPLLGLALMGLMATLLLFFNYSTVINWRYFLTGLTALVPLAADYFMRSQTELLTTPRRAFWSAALSVVLIGFVSAMYLNPISKTYIRNRSQTMMYRERLAQLPPDAVVMAGSQTVAVTYWRGIGLGRWWTIGTGGGWPGDNLIPWIEGYLKDGRRVFLDADLRWWSPCGWQRDETRALIKLESHFRFRRVNETIYEIRPLDDTTAQDDPQLEKLLPENRPQETVRCPPLDKKA